MGANIVKEAGFRFPQRRRPPAQRPTARTTGRQTLQTTRDLREAKPRRGVTAAFDGRARTARDACCRHIWMRRNAWGAAESAATMPVETAALPRSSKSGDACGGKALAEEAGIGDDERARTARDACCNQRFWMRRNAWGAAESAAAMSVETAALLAALKQVGRCMWRRRRRRAQASREGRL